jgi:hypothetical protein
MRRARGIAAEGRRAETDSHIFGLVELAGLCGQHQRNQLTGHSFSSLKEKNAMDNLTKKEQPDRSKINMHEVHELKYWAKELGISKEKLREAVDKVGNSAAAVRKELATA